MQILYAMETSNRSHSEVLPAILDDSSAKEFQKAYATLLTDRFVEHSAKVDEVLSESLENWTLDRLAVMDRALLHLGVTELLYSSEVPSKVVISEVSALGRKFSTEDSGAFLNGVLNRVMTNISKFGTSDS